MKKFRLFYLVFIFMLVFAPAMVQAAFIPADSPEGDPPAGHGNYFDETFPPGSGTAYDTSYGQGGCPTVSDPAGQFRCYAWSAGNTFNGKLEQEYVLLADTSLCDSLVTPNTPVSTMICGREAFCGIRSEVSNQNGYACYNTNNINLSDYSCQEFYCPYSTGYRCCRENTQGGSGSDPDVVPVNDPNSGQGGQSTGGQSSGGGGAISQPKQYTQAQEAPIRVSPGDCCKQIVPPINDNEKYTLNHLVQMGINIYECILCVVGALILLMIVVGGVILMTSAGSNDRVAAGKRMIAGAVVGGIIVIASYLIVYAVVMALGGRFDEESKLKINPGAVIERQQENMG